MLSYFDDPLLFCNEVNDLAIGIQVQKFKQSLCVDSYRVLDGNTLNQDQNVYVELRIADIRFGFTLMPFWVHFTRQCTLKNFLKIDSENTLHQIELYAVIVHYVEVLRQVIDAIGGDKRINKHIVNVYLQCEAKFVGKHFIDQFLVSHSCIFQSKRHDLIQ